MAPSSSGSYLNPATSYGVLTDSRNGQDYKTVVIGAQTWMAQNLNFTPTSGSWCYESNASNCSTFGRLYDYASAQTAGLSTHTPC